jgi:hypothetical protein
MLLPASAQPVISENGVMVNGELLSAGFIPAFDVHTAESLDEF